MLRPASHAFATPISLVRPEDLCHATGHASSEITFVDARTRAEYEREHIAGAIWMGWEDWCARPPRHATSGLARRGYWGVLADQPERIARRLGRVGLDAHAPIVVYAGGVASKGRDGRVAWMLLYFGATRVGLLDGGYQAWRGPRSVRPPRRRSSSFRVALDERRRARLADLRRLHHTGALPVLLDTRSLREFRGLDFRYMPRMGRIPGSVLLPFASVYDEHGRFVSRDAYRALLARIAVGGRACLAYCEVGVRAATIALLHEVHTGELVAVYDGSLMEWSLEGDLPMASERRGGQPPCAAALRSS